MHASRPALHSFPTRRSSDLYASADQGTSGLLIFNLEYVPDSVVLVNQTQEFFLRAHNIWIDEANGRLYTAGGTNGTGTTILDRKSTRLNSSHVKNSYAVFCL